MNPTRRQLLARAGGAALVVSSLGDRMGAAVADVPHQSLPPSGTSLGSARRPDFDIEEGYTYINAAYTHPIPKVALLAGGNAGHLRGSLRSSAAANQAARPDPIRLFAQIIGAQPEEIAYVPSTSFGENLVTQSLGLHHRFDGNVVTDGLHFEGALMHLFELGKKGLDVRVVRPNQEFRIDLKDLERVVDRNTRLIEISAVAMYNGFEHDLKAVADLAHAHKAYVYVDLVQAAGTGPLDITATGVDFAACSTFKWLMGDFGLGFLYARQDVLRTLDRPVVGYEEGDVESFYPPNLPEGKYAPIEYKLENTSQGHFQPGTSAFSGGSVGAALLAGSLSYIQQLGLDNIKAHRQPLLRKLHQEVPRFGFTAVTPSDSTSGIITFAKRNVGESGLPQKLRAANINVRFSKHWMRLSPSVYNDEADIDRFLAALS